MNDTGARKTLELTLSNDTRNGTFNTLDDALQALRRACEEQENTDITLTLDGVFPLSETLALDEGLSGVNGNTVTVCAADGKKAALSGGASVDGWEKWKDGIVWTYLPDCDDIKSLFVRGHSRSRACLPETGFYFPDQDNPLSSADWANNGYEAQGDETAAMYTLRYRAGDIEPESIRNLTDAELVVYQFWMESRLQIRAIDAESRVISCVPGEINFRPLSWSFGYSLDNVFEGIGRPGAWYFDKAEKQLYYHLMDGETAEALEAYVPTLKTLLSVKPSEGNTIENLTFKGLTFEMTDWLPPQLAGLFIERHAPVAVVCEGMKGCRFENCRFQMLGGAALEFGDGCYDNAIEDCIFSDIGAGALLAGRDGEKTGKTAFCNNRISDGGLRYFGAAAVWTGFSGQNKLCHNEISGGFQWGISSGWNWSFFPLTPSRDNLIEYNYIHDLGTGVLGTHGAIYILGTSPGTVIRNNYILRVYSNEFWGAGEGIILDNGCAGILIENNVVDDASAGGWGCNFNCFGNMIINNLFLYGDKFQLTRYGDAPNTPYPPPNGEIFSRNVVVWRNAPLFHEEHWFAHATCWDYNLYWNETGEVRFMSDSPEEWREKGLDVHSVVADPLFTAKGDGVYTFAPESPVYALGYKDIDLSTVGVR